MSLFQTVGREVRRDLNLHFSTIEVALKSQILLDMLQPTIPWVMKYDIDSNRTDLP